jgi:glucose-6-phosphate 1-epimerase
MEAAVSCTELDRRFGIPGIAKVVEGNGELPKVCFASPAAVGEMYLHGAHITSWQPSGADELLFLSAKSRWQEGIAIRGGVPICFPWFGDKRDDPKAPAHGFVRTKSWQLDGIALSGDDVTVTMSTGSDAGTKRWWPADFRLTYRAVFGRELSLELELRNISTTPLRFEEALHAYLRVGDVRMARLAGMDGVHYLDKTDAYRERVQQGDVVLSGETDRVYLNTSSPLELTDLVLRRRVRLAKDDSLTTVIWNPWTVKAKAMADLGDDEWAQMLCVETSNVLDFAVEVAPGAQHRMSAVIQIDNF